MRNQPKTTASGQPAPKANPTTQAKQNNPAFPNVKDPKHVPREFKYSLPLTQGPVFEKGTILCHTVRPER